MLNEDREALRSEWVGALPSWYSPWAHIGFTTVFGLGASALALSQIHHLRPLQLLIVPLLYVFSNAVEWRAHRDMLHKPLPGAKLIYKRHSLEHHRLYLTHDMEVRSWKELYLVLLPPYGILLILVGTFPIAVALWLFGQQNLAALFVITTQAYVVSYEWLHMAYHLPKGTWLGDNAVVRRLARHHAVHHSLERMSRWNMNVTLPLWDWVRGTIYRGEIEPPPIADPSIAETGGIRGG
jgi:hypothetical protein